MSYLDQAQNPRRRATALATTAAVHAALAVAVVTGLSVAGYAPLKTYDPIIEFPVEPEPPEPAPPPPQPSDPVVTLPRAPEPPLELRPVPDPMIEPTDCIVYAEDPARDRAAFEAWLERELGQRLDVERSHDRDAARAAEFPDGFLFFRYRVEVENFSGSGPFRGMDMAETTASIEQTIELGGKRSARVAVGRADLQAARARAARVQGEFAFDLAAAYAEADASERRLQIATDQATLAQEDLRIASALVDAGREADLRRVQAQAAL